VHPRPQAWSRPATDARDNQGKQLIDAHRQPKSATDKNSLQTFALQMIITSLSAAASNSDCRRRSHPDCRARRGVRELRVRPAARTHGK
jgi:hypothetical protein